MWMGDIWVSKCLWERCMSWKQKIMMQKIFSIVDVFFTFSNNLKSWYSNISVAHVLNKRKIIDLQPKHLLQNNKFIHPTVCHIWKNYEDKEVWNYLNSPFSTFSRNMIVNIAFFLFVLLRQGFSMQSWLSWNSLGRLSWPQIHTAACLCLLSVWIKGVQPPLLALYLFKYKSSQQ